MSTSSFIDRGLIPKSQESEILKGISGHAKTVSLFVLAMQSSVQKLRRRGYESDLVAMSIDLDRFSIGILIGKQLIPFYAIYRPGGNPVYSIGYPSEIDKDGAFVNGLLVDLRAKRISDVIVKMVTESINSDDSTLYEIIEVPN